MSLTKDDNLDIEYKVYSQRWIIMALFIVYTINGGTQWIQFSIISDTIVKYYSISPTTVEWTSNIFSVSYIIFVLPSLYLMDKIGIRNTMIIGTTGTVVGSWCKVFSVEPSRFHLVFIGQSLQAVFENITLSLAARFTAVWFGAKEISLAGSLALIGDQLGGAIGLILPSAMIDLRNTDMKVIECGLRRMHWVVAGASTVVMILIFIFFKEKPPRPASAAQVLQMQTKKENVTKTLSTLFKQTSFILIIASYGLCYGAFNALLILLNQVILKRFPGYGEEVGNIGSSMMMSGMIGSLILGYLLDKTHLFKENAVILSSCSTISAAYFTWSLYYRSIVNTYVAATLLGFFVQGYYVTGIQMAIEATYPATEDISSAMMQLAVHILSLLITPIYGYAVKHHEFGDLESNVCLTSVFLLSAIFALFIPSKLKRQDIEKSVKIEEIKQFI